MDDDDNSNSDYVDWRHSVGGREVQQIICRLKLSRDFVNESLKWIFRDFLATKFT